MSDENKGNLKGNKKGVAIAASAVILTGAVGGTVYYLSDSDEQIAPGDGGVIGDVASSDNGDKDYLVDGKLDRDSVVEGLDDEDDADVVAIIEDLEREKEEVLLAEQDISEDFTGVEKDEALAKVIESDTSRGIVVEDDVILADAGDIFERMGVEDDTVSTSPEKPVDLPKPETPKTGLDEDKVDVGVDIEEEEDEGKNEDVGSGGKEDSNEDEGSNEGGTGGSGNKDEEGDETGGTGGNEGGSSGEGDTGSGGTGGDEKPEPTPSPVDVAKADLQKTLQGFGTVKQGDYTGYSYSNYRVAYNVANNISNMGTSVSVIKEAKDDVTGAYKNLVSISDLRGLVNDTVTKEDYTLKSYDHFKSVQIEAGNILNGWSSTKKEIENAEKSIKDAKKGLISVVELRTALKDANSLNRGDYTLESYNKFGEVVKEVTGVFHKEDATKAELQDAEEQLKGAKKELVDVTGLRDVLSKVEEPSEQDYTANSLAAFKADIEESEQVLGKVDASKQEIKDAIKVVEDAYTRLISVKELREVIEIAKGLSSSDYVTDTWTPFHYELYKTEKVLEKADATKEEIDKAETDLQKAMDNLQEYTSLEELERLYGSVEGYDRDDYSGHGWSKFYNQRAEAKRLIDEDSSIKYRVHQVYNDLEGAKNELVSVVDLKQIVGKAADLKGELGMPASTVRALEEAIASAEDVIKGGTVEEVAEAEENLTQLIGEADPILAEYIGELEGDVSAFELKGTELEGKAEEYNKNKETLKGLNKVAQELINKESTEVTKDDVDTFKGLKEEYQKELDKLEQERETLESLTGTVLEDVEVLFNKIEGYKNSDDLSDDDYDIIVRGLEVYGKEDVLVELGKIKGELAEYLGDLGKGLGNDLDFPEGDVALDVGGIKVELGEINESIKGLDSDFAKEYAEYERLGEEILGVSVQAEELSNKEDVTEEDVRVFNNLKDDYDRLKGAIDSKIGTLNNIAGEYDGKTSEMSKELKGLEGYLTANEIEDVRAGLLTVEEIQQGKNVIQEGVDSLTNNMYFPENAPELPLQPIEPEERDKEEDVEEAGDKEEGSESVENAVDEKVEEERGEKEVEEVEEEDNEEDVEAEEESNEE